LPIRNTKVLLVEDDAQLRALLTVILTRSGYRVRCAEDGFCALAEIRADMPDVLLSDLHMVGMSGFELLSVVRRRLPSIRVIAMSSAFSGGEVPTGVAADAFYQKATSIVSLLRLVEDAGGLDDLHVARRRVAPAPIWIATECPEARVLAISCPECLRTGDYAPARGMSLIHETNCSYCRMPIHYAMVQSVDPGPPAASLQRLALLAPTPQHAAGLD
jgi:CheY-like chemotaxis protein